MHPDTQTPIPSGGREVGSSTCPSGAVSIAKYFGYRVFIMKPLSEKQVQQYHDVGYVIVPGVIGQDEAARLIEHYMARRAEGPKPLDYGGADENPDDPNHRYPRMLNMQEWDKVSEELTQHAELLAIASQLIDDEPELSQTMVYFKPPGGSGQGLHQDQQYIPIEPLIGVWIPLETSNRDVGTMTVVPGSHQLGLLPVERADTSISFTAVQSSVPKEASEEIGLDLNAGDALFFHGKLVHGSYPNTTTDRWRRTFIVHYVGKHAEEFKPPKGKHVSDIPSINPP